MVAGKNIEDLEIKKKVFQKWLTRRTKEWIHTRDNVLREIAYGKEKIQKV